MARRRVRRSRRSQTLLPLRINHLSHTLSCWYCDYKISAFNELLFSIGCKYARYLRVWFTVGVAFSIMAVIGSILILLSEMTGASHLYNGTVTREEFPVGMLFGLIPMVPALRISIIDMGYMIISTLISIAAHEFGHAIAAASEGIHIEYIAIFLAVLFPGALVAFNYEVLQNLHHFTALRVYCAGIWHNAVCCAVCGLALFLLPFILHPLYVHGEHPMVLGVTPTSSFSGYLSHGDIILSLDGSPIHSPQDWMRKMVPMYDNTQEQSGYLENGRSPWIGHGGKGYCVPNSWVEESMKIQPIGDLSACPNELAAFKGQTCYNSSGLDDNIDNVIHQNRSQNTYCLPAKDVVKLKKCGNGWQTTGTEESSCPCMQEEFCSAPVQMRGLTWIEIAYSSPYSADCSQLGRNQSAVTNPDSGSTNCVTSFVFIGDAHSEAHSVQLTAYRPRWAFNFGVYLPNMFEKMLAYISHVSATLALLNSLPVFFLDGESILEMGLCCITWLSPRGRKRVLQLCLLSGSLLSIMAILRIFSSLILNVL